MRYLTLAYIQYADGRRRPENDVTMFKTQVEPRANGFTAKFFRRQCSTQIFLDTRHWASEFKKSLAHEEKPLVQEELKWFETLQVSDTCKVSNFVACTRPGFRTFLTLYRVQIEIFRSVTKVEFSFAYHHCSSPYKFHSMNRNQGYVFF